MVITAHLTELVTRHKFEENVSYLLIMLLAAFSFSSDFCPYFCTSAATLRYQWAFVVSPLELLKCSWHFTNDNNYNGLKVNPVRPSLCHYLVVTGILKQDNHQAARRITNGLKDCAKCTMIIML